MGGPGSGSKPREYPPEVVKQIIDLYESGMTVAEVRAAAPKGVRVQTVLERHLPSRRPAVKRNQLGAANDSWKGSSADYQAVHLRLKMLRGTATSHSCVDCGGTACDWSYEHDCTDERRNRRGTPFCHHPEHYAPRCRPCHRTYDRKDVMPNA